MPSSDAGAVSSYAPNSMSIPGNVGSDMASSTVRSSINPDSALHEFSYEERKFFVRLNQFVSINRFQRVNLLSFIYIEWLKSTVRIP